MEKLGLEMGKSRNDVQAGFGGATFLAAYRYGRVAGGA